MTAPIVVTRGHPDGQCWNASSTIWHIDSQEWPNYGLSKVRYPGSEENSQKLMILMVVQQSILQTALMDVPKIWKFVNLVLEEGPKFISSTLDGRLLKTFSCQVKLSKSLPQEWISTPKSSTSWGHFGISMQSHDWASIVNWGPNFEDLDKFLDVLQWNCKSCHFFIFQ